jgi:hypothetical protein
MIFGKKRIEKKESNEQKSRDGEHVFAAKNKNKNT